MATLSAPISRWLTRCESAPCESTTSRAPTAALPRKLPSGDDVRPPLPTDTPLCRSERDVFGLVAVVTSLGVGAETGGLAAGGIDSDAGDMAGGGSRCDALGRRGLGLLAELDDGLEPGEGVEGADAGRGPKGDSGGLSGAQYPRRGRREVELVTTRACSSDTRKEQSSSMYGVDVHEPPAGLLAALVTAEEWAAASAAQLMTRLHLRGSAPH